MESRVNLNNLLKQLIVIAIIATSIGLFYPLTSASFGPWYGSIAKHITLSNNWSDLVLSNEDWLDKPHFPFWITALFFRVFGINSFAYILPGFLFHLIGALYTYKLTNYLYKNHTMALLATLIYLSIFHLIISAIDVRAEAYLLGEIMPACYYWLNYDQKFSCKNLIFGAFFTGLALMTKGIFVIITIVSGLLCLWVYTRRLINIIHPKWILALGLSLVFAIPELVALYIQFDLHPEKIIFGHTHVSGIRWFFIDSQFGRFFGTGYIMSTNPPPFHELFFIHTFLWAFLPWSLIYPVAVYYSVRYFKKQTSNDKKTTIILLGYFWVSFIMFSLTTFQVDHYTNIIFPFAAIMCAKLIFDLSATRHKIFTIEHWLSIIMLVLLGVIIAFVFHGTLLLIFVAIEIAAISYLLKSWGEPPFIKAILLPVIAISLTISVYQVINGKLFAPYDPGIKAAAIIQENVSIPVVDFEMDSRSLEFYSQNKYYKTNDLANVASLHKYFIVTPHKKLDLVMQTYPQAKIVAEIQGNTSDKILPNLWSKERIAANLESFNIILVSP